MYIYAWISKYFGTIIVLGEAKKPFETFFSGRLKVKVTGVKVRSKWSIISLSGPSLVQLCMDFKNNFAQLLSLKRRSAI